MSKQLTIPASSIRGKDWRNISPDSLDTRPDTPLESNLDKLQGNTGKIEMRLRTPNNGNFGHEGMNKLEARYARYLDELVQKGEIVFWRFEGIKLILAETCTYLPDFFIVRSDGVAEFHETKGFWRDDARVKVKVAAQILPVFFFYGVKWHKKDGWEWEPFSAAAKERMKCVRF